MATYDYDLGVIGGGAGGLTVTAGAAQLGAGPIGLLATMALILRGLHLCTFARTRPPYGNGELLAEIGGCYHSTKDVTLTEASGDHGGFDIMFEATGQSPLVFEAMNVLGENRVLMLSNVTGGGAVRRTSCLRKRI
jgi:glucose 1-dehydrogenase